MSGISSRKRVWKFLFETWNRFFHWIAESHPQGLGTLLIGVAAMFALIQSSSLLDRVLQIQEQAKDIRAAVTELKNQTLQVSAAIELLGSQMKALRATQQIAAAPALTAPRATKAELADAIRSIPSSPTKGAATVYLPEKKREATIDSLYRASTAQQRQVILQNSLELSSPKRIQTEDGVDLMTEDGHPLIIESPRDSK